MRGQVSKSDAVPSSIGGRNAVDTLASKLEEYIDANRRLQNVLSWREAELLELKGHCSNKACRLHYAHSGPCAPIASGSAPDAGGSTHE